jgi:hypothetical protein
MLSVLRDLYHCDAYRLQDGDKITPNIHPAKGLKQGCPLSPLLFSLFISDIGSKLNEDAGNGNWGVPVKLNDSTVFYITHLLYADDLTLVACSEDALGYLLYNLSHYAKRKGLTVNVDKCAAMTFFAGKDTPELDVRYEGRRIPVVKEFKYLGIWFDERMNMRRAADRLCGSLYASLGNVLQQANMLGIRDMPHIMLFLIQTFVLPGALYGAQVWGSDLLDPGVRMTHFKLQRVLLGIYRRLLGVRVATRSENIVDEVGAYPLQYYWLRLCLRFWNSCISSDNSLLDRIMRAEVFLARSECRPCWLFNVNEALSRFCSYGELGFEQGSDNLEAVQVHQVLEEWSEYQFQLRSVMCGDPTEEFPEHRQLSMYLNHFRLERNNQGRIPLHPYLSIGSCISPSVRKSMSCLRLCSNGLLMNRIRPRNHMNANLNRDDWCCPRCDTIIEGVKPLDDEHHLLFHCMSTNHLRHDPRFVSLPFTDLSALMHVDDCIPLCHYVHECLLIATPNE